jgi:hypothetical protein
MRYTEVAERRPVDVGSDSAGGFHLFAVVFPSCPLCLVSAGSKQLSLAEFITINSMSRRLQWTRGKYEGQVNIRAGEDGHVKDRRVRTDPSDFFSHCGTCKF